MCSRVPVRPLCALALTACVGSAALAQSSELYMFQFDSGAGQFKVFQNGNVQRTWNGHGLTTPGREYGIAVADDVRSIDYFGSSKGAQYSLTGTQSGVTYAHGLSSFAAIDGTTDGATSNWAGNYFGNEIYRWDRDWANPVLAFNVEGTSVSGITYDVGNSSLWIFVAGSGVIGQYDLGGKLISSFQVSTNSTDNMLAYEPATQTIWMKPRSSAEIRQYSRSGDLLQTVGLADSNLNTLGMEFSITGIPTPGALSLLGLGGMALGRRRR